LNQYRLPGGQVFTQIVAVVIVASEIFALPFLLRMRLSRAARGASILVGFMAVFTWLSLLDWSLMEHQNHTQSGLFGTMFVQVNTLAAFAFVVGLSGLIIWCFWLLQARSVIAPHARQLKK
jgi:membrane-associated HD superfamily phosphohydrolase